MRKVSMSKVREVLRLRFKLGLSLRKSAKATNTSKSTASEYCKRFEAIDLEIDSFLNLNEEKQEELLFPVKNRVKATKQLPDFQTVHNELKNARKTRVTLALLHQEYKENNPDGYSYTQFREHYTRHTKKLNPSMRQIHFPGDKLFVDYSGFIMDIADIKTGEITKAQIFVAVLGASGYTFVHATSSQKKEDFILSHTLAYEFFGGTPNIVVPDNLKSAITSNNKNGVVVNESYGELARHYNMAVEPARPYKPKDKSKAEQGVLGIQRWILAALRHRKFFSVDELNEAISYLLDKYNNKIVKRYNKSRTDLFKELDEPYLQQLPANRYVYREFRLATVNQNYHIMLDRCEYSVPFKYIKQKVEVRHSSATVEIYCKNRLIATHPKLYRKYEASTLTEHMPTNHQYQFEKMNPERLKSWGNSIGVNGGEFVKKVFETVEHPHNAYSKIIAILSLAKIYGKYELELAIGYGTKHNTTSTKSMRSILDKKLYLSDPINNRVTNSLFDNHENLRGNIYK